jgi:signal peptidase I, bacterial type
MVPKLENKNIIYLEWIESITLSLISIILIFTFIFRITTVSGISMVPTLNNHDKVIVSNLFYVPERQDVVVIDTFTSYGQPLVKRIIGLPGDEVDINFTTGEVFVNGQLQDEPYISALTTQQLDINFPIIVPNNTVFVMGDNRPYSLDGRSSSIGFINVRNILGKALYRVYPFSNLGRVL